MARKKDILKATKEEIRYFEDKLSKEEMVDIAEKNKTKAFGFFSGLKSKFSGDKKDIKLNKIVKRFDPFWELVAESSVDYERASNYKVTVSKEVKGLRIGNKDFDGSEGRNYNTVSFESIDLCNETRKRGMLIDGTLQVKNPSNLKHTKRFEKYVKESSKKIKHIKDLDRKDVMISTVRVKASFILRSILQEIIHPVDADKITNEEIEVKKLILYFIPSYIFEYENTKKNLKGYVSVNTITGEVSYIKEMNLYKAKQPITETAVFDIGVSALSSLVPGGEATYRLIKGIQRERRFKKSKA